MQLAEATTGHKQPDCLVLIYTGFYYFYNFIFISITSGCSILWLIQCQCLFFSLYKHATDVQEQAVGQLFLFFYSAVITACVRSTRTRAAGIVLFCSGTTHAR